MNRLDLRLQRIPPDLILALSTIDRLNGQWIGSNKPTTQIMESLRQSVIIASTGASTRIEGSQLSDAEIKKLMGDLSIQKFTDRDAQEVRGYYELLHFVFLNYEGITLSENMIKQLHSRLLQYTDKDSRHRGFYKKLDNQVEIKDALGQQLAVVFKTTPAYLTAKEMSELVVWTNEVWQARLYHPLLTIANFIVEFLKIHPFLDGNGRLSRILTNLLMLKAGYEFVPYVAHEKIIENNKTNYYLALRQSQSTFQQADETIGPWLSFFLRTVVEQAEQALPLITDELNENLLSPIQLAIWQCFTLSEQELTVRQLADETKIAHSSIKKALERLMSLRKIQRIGQGRSSRYKKF